MKTAIIIGHTKKHQGAFSDYFKMNEWSFYNKVTAYLNNVDVYHHNHDTIGYTNRVKETCKKLNNKNYDLVIACHFNAFNNHANGCETLYYYRSVKGKMFAKKFSDLIHKRTGIKLRNNGFKSLANVRDRGFAMLFNPKAPTILIEPFFGDNISDCKKINSPKDLAKIINEFIKSVK